MSNIPKMRQLPTPASTWILRHGAKNSDGRGGTGKEEGKEASTSLERQQSSLDGTDLFFLF